nr:carboxylesterase [Pharsalia antennata]
MLSKVLLVFLSITSALSEVTINLPDGRIRGVEKLSLRNRTYYAFLQVPYAEPPLGKLRFRDPRHVQPWSGILDATQEKKICYQVSSNSALENEDCLYLNVYTPVKYNAKNTRSSLPVMFYIHGGGFMNGNSLYSTIRPHHFMDNNVIVVTISYRLGPFGFLSTGDYVIPGNYGLKDQNMALKWVKRNIEYFGGDPNKVTIFGQSSGAVSVGYHIISKQSEGLFRGAIQQSGSVLAPHGYQRRAKDFAYTLAKLIDPTFSESSDSWDLLVLLQNATAEQIDAATETFTQAPGSLILSDGSWFAPVIENDHEDAFITERMYGSLEKGNFNKVPLVVGMTSEEGIGHAADLEAFKLTVEQFDNNLTFFVQADMHIADLTRKTQAGEAIRKIYTDGLLKDNLGQAVKYFTDFSISRPVIKHAELQSAYSSVYFYQFSYHGALGGNNVSVEGAGRVGHSEDMRYLWTFSDSQSIQDIDAKDLQVLDRHVKMFTDFAKTLNPTPGHLRTKKNSAQNIKWCKVNATQNFTYLDIDERLTLKINPKEPAYSRWVSFYDTWAIPPFDTY